MRALIIAPVLFLLVACSSINPLPPTLSPANQAFVAVNVTLQELVPQVKSMRDAGVISESTDNTVIRPALRTIKVSVDEARVYLNNDDEVNGLKHVNLAKGGIVVLKSILKEFE